MSAAVTLPEPSTPAGFILRDEVPDDRRFVCRTWTESERESSGRAEGRYYWAWQNAQIDGILRRPSTRVIIASPEGDDSIAGWCAISSAVSAPVVYFVYVRPEARKLGLARMLLGHLCERRDVIYTTRPPRERDERGVWGTSPVPIPKGWRYMPRAAFLEVPR